MRGKFALIITALVVLIAFFRFAHLGYSEFQSDESKVALKAISIIKGTDSLLFWHKKGPMEILLTAGVFSLTRAYSAWTARVPFALANLCGVLLLYLLARRWWNDRVAALVALLGALLGYFVGYGRLLQYQSGVILFTALIIYCFHRFYTTGRNRHLITGAGLIGVSLLMHYDALFSIPPALYLAYCTLGRDWRAYLSRWRVLLLAVALIIGIPALYFAPFALSPHVSVTATYLGGRIGGAPPYNNLRDFFELTLVYDSVYYFAILFSLVALQLTAQLYRTTNAGKLLAALWVISLAMIITTHAQSWTFAGRDWIFAPFAAAFLFLWFASRPPTALKATLLWFFAPFLLYIFGIADPRSHVYCFYSTALLLAALMLDEIISRVPYRRAVIGGLLALYLPLAYYPYMVFVQHVPEYQRNFAELRHPFYWTPYTELDPGAYFGFPYRAGWRTIAYLYRVGELRGDYESNEKISVTDWYLPRQQHQACYPRYYILAEGAKSKTAIPQDDLARYYGEIINVTVNGAVKMRVYEWGAVVEQAKAYADEEYAARFMRAVSLNDYPAFPCVWCDPTAKFGETLLQFDAQLCRQCMPAPQYPLDVNFNNQVRLRGFDLHEDDAGLSLLVTLYWDVRDPPKDMDSVFVHLETDRLWGQGDSVPVCNLHQTDRWTPGEIVADRHLITLETAPPPGEYPLTVGFYRWADGARLPVLNEQGAVIDNSVTLTKIQVE